MTRLVLCMLIATPLAAVAAQLGRQRTPDTEFSVVEARRTSRAIGPGVS